MWSTRRKHLEAFAKNRSDSMEDMTMLIKSSELPGPPAGRRFVGAEHGDVPVSLFLVSARAGLGPRLHRHPYPEIFVVDAGQGEFQIGAGHLIAAPGDILIAPAGAPHRFASVGNEHLRLTAIHTAPAMDTEWLTSHTATLASRTGATVGLTVPLGTRRRCA